MKQYNCPDCLMMMNTCDFCYRAQNLNNNFNAIPSCCIGCSNHPNNGGSGNCNCVLPYMTNSPLTPYNYYVTI